MPWKVRANDVVDGHHKCMYMKTAESEETYRKVSRTRFSCRQGGYGKGNDYTYEDSHHVHCPIMFIVSLDLLMINPKNAICGRSCLVDL
jgi:hypothetical protein